MQENEMITLVKRVQNKDEQAFIELYEQYCNLVFSQAYKATRSYSEAQDIAQEVFLQVYKSIESLREPKLFPIWLYRITTSKCVKVYREHRPAFIEGDMLAEMSVQEEHQDFNPENSMHFHHDRAMLEFFISCLKENVQQIIRAMYLEQKSMKEMSEQFHIPLGTVKYLAYEGRKDLKAMIQNYERSNHVKLDFHTSSPALLSIPVFAVLASWFKEHRLLFRRTVQLAVSASAAVVVIQGVSVILPELTQPETMEEISKPTSLSQDSMVTFPTIQVYEKVYTSASQAYAGLLEFSTKEDLLHQSKDVCVAYEPLVNALREYGGKYYMNLKQSGWIETYDTIMQNKQA